MAEIFYTVSPDLHRMARVEEGRVVELDFEIPSQSPSLLGGIYLGRVVEIQKSFQAAFVHIGLEKPGFLPLREGNLSTVKQGEVVLVQVSRTENPLENKGVRLTRLITLALGPLLYTPFRWGLNLSKKLKSRAAYKNLLMLSPEEGLVVRHWACAEEALKEIMERLRTEWSEILLKSSALKPPSLIRPSFHLIERISRTLGPADSLISDDRTYRGDKVLHSREKAFDERCEDAWESLFSPEILLPQGGSLYIEETRGLTVIDVNSGGAFRDNFSFNWMAVVEVLYQIRLRELGGKIVVDLISSSQKREFPLKGLALPSDLEVWGISPLGLLEMIRRRTRLSLPQRLKLQIN